MKPLITYLEVLPVQLSSTIYVCSSTTSYTCPQTSHFFFECNIQFKTYLLTVLKWPYKDNSWWRSRVHSHVSQGSQCANTRTFIVGHLRIGATAFQLSR